MKLLSFLLPAVLLVLTMACGHTEPGGEPDTKADADGLLVAEPEAGPFTKQLTFPGGYKLRVSTEGDGEHQQFTITGLIKGRSLQQPIKGTVPPVTGADIADLNKDGQPEVYLFTRVPGANSYGKVFGFNFTSSGFWAQIEVQNLREDMMRGYQGQDTFMVENGQLYRSFPIYLNSDEEGSPSGGARKIVYHLVPGDSTLALQPRGAL